MYLVRLVIESTTLIFVATVSVYQDIAAQCIFCIFCKIMYQPRVLIYEIERVRGVTPVIPFGS